MGVEFDLSCSLTQRRVMLIDALVLTGLKTVNVVVPLS